METQFKFFIVDDDIFYANVYEQFLQDNNFELIGSYENGNDCISNLNLNPDIIILDHNMEGITGFEVLKKIKRYNPNIYVIMISSQGSINVAVDSLKYGAFDYVIKNDKIADNLLHVIQKIQKVKEELKKLNPTFFQKLLSYL